MTDTANMQSALKFDHTTSRLMTFCPPTPSKCMIRTMDPLNRWLMLGGIPGLRRLPILGAVPGLRGIMNIPEIDFPEAERQRLRDSVNPQTASFITPNHPEFFTDWMLDKYVLGHVAPMAASWATHAIVNGLGPAAQKFWLKNNLIAQIPGAGGRDGKEFSMAWAQKGNGVLLHPEGSVGWHCDKIGCLFPGAAEMALELHKRLTQAGDQRQVFIAPVVWKLFFIKDVRAGLAKELTWIERRLQLPQSDQSGDIAQRLYGVYDSLLARDEVKWQVHPTDAPYFDRLARLQNKLHDQLRAGLDDVSAPGADSQHLRDQVRRAARWLRQAEKTDPNRDQIRSLSKDLERLMRLDRTFYPTSVLSQEHIAESLKRLRSDYCKGSLRDTMHNYVPQPVGPRRAVIRVAEPVSVTGSVGQDAEQITNALQRRMQETLDRLNGEQSERQQSYPTFQNRFLAD